ncbi:PTS sugar transporter subunit IIA [Candidatus Enterococcus courvalinii]|uniref:PTS mannose transporter subunit IIA n=1 Tax=Candidatus Enterococcus courvalinii TaxID=2815329 RepID=A0ABS3I204_9ENTE|nr:PTS mannose transporter subunit IIA [Enterococcus sp. MSG2901]MBO0482756.1 PTS mannose transporter subunit IIA [Enterococcus sp. MSG2901]
MKFLITGHNDFSIGMKSALTMIAGPLEGLTIVPFRAEETLEAYRKKIELELQAKDSVICFTDLLGGTPFKTCVELAISKNQVFVLSGTNLGMLLEASLLRELVKEPAELCQLVLQSGKDNITLFSQNANTLIEEISESGI